MKIFLLFLVVSATVLESSDAAQRARFVTIWPTQERQPMIFKEIPTKIYHEEEFQEVTVKRLHERMLRMNTHDYERYDAAPTLSKPRSKLIPN